MIATQIHDEVVEELAGRRCDALVGIGDGSAPDAAMFAFMRVDGEWLRFFLDVGVLFMAPSEGPANRDDVLPEDEIIDLLPAAEPCTIAAAEIRDGVFRIELADGGHIAFSEDPETSMMRIARGP